MLNDEFDLDIQLTSEVEQERAREESEPTTFTQITCYETCGGGTCGTCVHVPC